MKKKINDKEKSLKKETGSYYTPTILSDFMVFHLFTKYNFGKKISILEPSCGDGVFFDSIFNNEIFKNRPEFKKNFPSHIAIDAVEKEGDELALSKKKSERYLSASKKINFFHNDYLKYRLKNDKKFDLVIGNPPYIKMNYLTKEQIKFCQKIHKEAGLDSKKIKNIWTSFLISGVNSLNKQGVLAFVLPAELLQVIYAKELRNYLRKNFQRIEIFTFNDLVFPDIEQDVIILICARNNSSGVSFYHVNKLESLKKPSYVAENSNIHRETLDKWTNYILSDGELKFLEGLKKRLQPIKNYCTAEVGIVTAANDFFIVNKDVLEKYSLTRYSKPILQKGSFMPATLSFTEKDHSKIVAGKKPSFFLAFPNKSEKGLPRTARDYLKEGEKENIHKRYKCLLRENWHFVPSVWVSDGFFTKRSNLFPRMAVNEAKVIVTDAFYRIRMREGKDISNLVFSFYNTLTFIFAELEGRYYGGSVLELTPNEFKNLAIPFLSTARKEYISKLDQLLRSETPITEILEFTDKLLLQEGLGLSEKEIRRLKTIYAKLVKRRLKKHKLIGF